MNVGLNIYTGPPQYVQLQVQCTPKPAGCLRVWGERILLELLAEQDDPVWHYGSLCVAIVRC